MKRCSSCGKLTKEFVEFPCPDCDCTIVRCNSCRLNKINYETECGFVGP